MKILIIEPHASTRDTLRFILEDVDYMVVAPETVEEGIALLDANQDAIDVVIVDFYAQTKDQERVINWLEHRVISSKCVVLVHHAVQDLCEDELGKKGMRCLAKPIRESDALHCISKLHYKENTKSHYSHKKNDYILELK